MNLFATAPDQPALDTVAANWLRNAGTDPLSVARGLILLPTRRAERALRDAFLRQSRGTPLLLPRTAVLGGLDETGLAMHAALDLPPAVDPMRRLSVLTRAILAMNGADGAPDSADRAWPLAVELAALLDEADRAEIDLAAGLPEAAEAGFAEHWQRTIRFLEIVTAFWPQWLRDNGLMDSGTRQVALLDAQRQAWEKTAPDIPILALAPARAIPAVARFLRTVAGLPQGQVVLPGLDMALPDPGWEALEPAHPQSGFRQLLAGMGATRGDVRLLPAIQPGHPARVHTLRRAMLPAACLEDWRAEPAAAPPGVMRLYPADQQEEALAIGLILRDALEQPDRRAALITPDRDLAMRVSAEMLRYGVMVDDSAGENLTDSPRGTFLRLVAQAALADLAPVPLLALLKHPLSAAGLTQTQCRALARRLELRALRGPRPAPGVAGLRQAVRDDARLLDFIVRLDTALAPLLRIIAQADVPPVDAMAALIAAAEALSTDDTDQSSLWGHEDGDALATLLAGAQAALPDLPPQSPAILPGLLDALMRGHTVRSRRALRGRDNIAEHPRLFIWGLREAQLQSVDVAILGGLAESVWPASTDPGPWMSRPMRHAVGLPSPEDRIGQMANDFIMAASSADTVILSCPKRRDGAPAVPARWLTRLDAFLKGGGETLPAHPAVGWARLLDQPAGPPRPVSPPAPCPPVHRRPRKLSVTEVETWLRDPYAIHARHILRLRALPGLDEATDMADYGSVVHDGIADFLRQIGTDFRADAATILRAAMDHALDRADLRPALVAWWRPRLRRIADWVAAEEKKRRDTEPPLEVGFEIPGEWVVTDCPAGPFTIRGRADRIERRGQAGLAILDYKTGIVPSQADVVTGLAPQLLLEAVMAETGGFGPSFAAPVRELTYWRLSGGFVPGETIALFKGDAQRVQDAMHTAREKIRALMQEFDNPTRAYLSQPHPGAAPRFSAYAQLARMAEWAAAEE